MNRLAEAEKRFHDSQPHPGQVLPWRITDQNTCVCTRCGFESRRYEHPAEASDAAVLHCRAEHPEARHG